MWPDLRRKLYVSDRERPLVAVVNGPLMAQRSGSMISLGLEFFLLSSAARRRGLEEYDDRQGDHNHHGGQDRACLTQIHGSGDCADQTWAKASDRLMISQPGLLAANRLP